MPSGKNLNSAGRPHEIRVLDLDAGRLMIEENLVKRAVRKTGIKARVSMVADNLAITRQGLLDAVPVLEIDGTIISRKTAFTMELLEDWFNRL